MYKKKTVEKHLPEIDRKISESVKSTVIEDYFTGESMSEALTLSL
jgi:hypothetical protein